MKPIILLFCLFFLLPGTYAQTSKGKSNSTKTTATPKKTPVKPAAKPVAPATKPADKPAATANAANTNNADLPNSPAATSEVVVKDGPLTKYELYSQIRSYLETNGLKNWLLAERLSNFIIAYKEPVTIAPEKSETTYESEQKELEALSKVYLPKAFEISLEFTPYSTEQYRPTVQTDESADKKLQELKEKYNIDQIFENVETKEYYAADNDERNRLTNFLIAKTFIEVNTNVSRPPQLLYIQNFSVTINYPQNYYLTIPKQAGAEAERIVQVVKTMIASQH